MLCIQNSFKPDSLPLGPEVIDELAALWIIVLEAAFTKAAAL